MSDNKKRKKAYYKQCGQSKKHRANYQLDADMKGFLITCNKNEKRAVFEAYSLFNEYADAMYGAEEVKNGSENDNSDCDDIEAAISKEIGAIKNESVRERRFQNVETKTSNCLFIRTTLERPDEITTKLFSDMHQSQTSKSRFILKLFPVLGTCRANDEKIEKLAEEILPPFFTKSEKQLTYCIVYKVRCNHTLSRDVILPLIGRVVHQIDPTIRVNFDNPDIVISVDVLQKVCCISVLTEFHKFRKYNVQEVANLKTNASTADPDLNIQALDTDPMVEASVVDPDHTIEKPALVPDDESNVSKEDPILQPDVPTVEDADPLLKEDKEIPETLSSENSGKLSEDLTVESGSNFEKENILKEVDCMDVVNKEVKKMEDEVECSNL